GGCGHGLRLRLARADDGAERERLGVLAGLLRLAARGPAHRARRRPVGTTDKREAQPAHERKHEPEHVPPRTSHSQLLWSVHWCISSLPGGSEQNTKLALSKRARPTDWPPGPRPRRSPTPTRRASPARTRSATGTGTPRPRTRPRTAGRTAPAPSASSRS